jgi:hypothetical protein
MSQGGCRVAAAANRQRSATNSDNEIADQPVACALLNLTCEPSGNEANN